MRRGEQDTLWLLIGIFCGGGLFQFGGGSIRSLGSLVMTRFNSRGWIGIRIGIFEAVARLI